MKYKKNGLLLKTANRITTCTVLVRSRFPFLTWVLDTGQSSVYMSFWKNGFLSLKKWRIGKVRGVKTEEMKIDSLRMWRSQKVKFKCEKGQRLWSWDTMVPPPQVYYGFINKWFFTKSKHTQTLPWFRWPLNLLLPVHNTLIML